MHETDHSDPYLHKESDLSFHINNHRGSYDALGAGATLRGGDDQGENRIYLTSPNMRTEERDQYNANGSNLHNSSGIHQNNNNTTGRIDTILSTEYPQTEITAQHSSATHSQRKGILQMIVASACISGSALLVKKVENDEISVFELIFYRSLFIILILFIMYKISELRRRARSPTDVNDDAHDQELQLLQTSMLHIDESVDHHPATPTPVRNIAQVTTTAGATTTTITIEEDNNNSQALTFVKLKERKFVQIYSVLNAIIMFSFFYGVKQMPLFEAISLQNCSLLFSGVFSCIAFTSTNAARNGNGLSFREIASALLIAVGVYLISLTAPLKATLVCVLGGSVTSAMIQIIVKKYATRTQFMTLLFYSSFVQLIVSPLLIYAYESFKAISAKDIAFIALMAFLQIIGTSFLQKSFVSFSDGRFVNFHVPLSILFTILLGHFFLHEPIVKTPLLGSLFIICSSVFIILSSQK